MADFLDAAIRHRCSILISGDTGPGKTTLPGAPAESVPADERIVTVDDALARLETLVLKTGLELSPAPAASRSWPPST